MGNRYPVQKACRGEIIQMAAQNIERKYGTGGNVSRRELLKESIALAVLYSVLRPVYGSAIGGQNRRLFAYVGTYGPSVDDGGGNGKGIYLFEMNPATGELSLIKLAAAARNASWLSLDPSGRYLYAANEVADVGGGTGSVSAFAVNQVNGNLQLLNVVSSEGAAPVQLSVDAYGKYVFVANYAGGSVAVLPILTTGALGPATYVHQDTNSVGPKIPSSAPPGSFAFSGHDNPHAHMIDADPGNRFVLQTDLGQDRIYISSFDRVAGKLSPLPDSPFVSLPPGDGPRHFAFHRNGRWMYSLQEEASTLVFFHFDPATGSLRPQQTISTLPPGFKGTSFTSEILLSPDGRFLYAANRLHDTIAIFSLNHEGRLDYLGETSTLGDYPRHIQLDPGGAFLYACNQRSDNIASFRVDQKTGLLMFTGRYTSIGSPACIVFLS
jgi:6-phosphogluconolactonase